MCAAALVAVATPASAAKGGTNLPINLRRPAPGADRSTFLGPGRFTLRARSSSLTLGRARSPSTPTPWRASPRSRRRPMATTSTSPMIHWVPAGPCQRTAPPTSGSPRDPTREVSSSLVAPAGLPTRPVLSATRAVSLTLRTPTPLQASRSRSPSWTSDGSATSPGPSRQRRCPSLRTGRERMAGRRSLSRRSTSRSPLA
jgi:hypothetical protein